MKKIFCTIATCVLLGVMASASAGNAAAGKAKSAVCAGCHGTNGISNIPHYPNLAGQKEVYMIQAIKDYKSGARNNATMKAMVANLSDEDIANLAAYYASLKP